MNDNRDTPPALRPEVAEAIEFFRRWYLPDIDCSATAIAAGAKFNVVVAELERLAAENAKLKGWISTIKEESSPIGDAYIQVLEAENAALRERLRAIEGKARSAWTAWKGWWFDSSDGPVIPPNAMHFRLALADLAACLDAGDQQTKGE